MNYIKILPDHVIKVRDNVVPKVYSILEQYPYIRELTKYLRKVREEVIKNFEYYIDKTIISIKKVGGEAYFAKDVSDVQKILRDLVGSNKIIVLGKSIVMGELNVRNFLENLGNEVWETDLGEFIIQLANEPPTHIIVPAMHKSRREVAQLFRRKLRVKVSEDTSIPELTLIVRSYLRQKFINAHIGITGANVIAADCGAVLLIENESNIRLTTSLPSTHIVIASIEKIVPTLYDAFIQVLIQSAYAGLYPPTYVNLTAGPSSTADIEYFRVIPSHGPKEVHVILVDNGRLRAAKDSVLWEALLCIKCGRCCWHCPTYLVLNGNFGIPPYSGPTGIMWSAIVYGIDKCGQVASLCLNCGLCKEVCPMSINIPKIIHNVKVKYTKESISRT